jgi:hypothetical protein
MEKAVQYRKRALRSREIANDVQAQGLRRLLLEIADDWDALAEILIERRTRPGVVLTALAGSKPRHLSLIDDAS